MVVMTAKKRSNLFLGAEMNAFQSGRSESKRRTISRSKMRVKTRAEVLIRLECCGDMLLRREACTAVSAMTMSTQNSSLFRMRVRNQERLRDMLDRSACVS